MINKFLMDMIVLKVKIYANLQILIPNFVVLGRVIALVRETDKSILLAILSLSSTVIVLGLDLIISRIKWEIDFI